MRGTLVRPEPGFITAPALFMRYYAAGVSENRASETVWKIAEGLSRVVHGRLETADRAPSTPIGRLRDPYFGIHPAFPNSFKAAILGNPPLAYSLSCGRWIVAYLALYAVWG